MFDDMLCKTDMLILPTKAECFGVVFCEASAYGIPSLSYATGGVTDAITNGVNGYTLDINKGPEDFADRIKSIIDDPDLIESLKRSSRKHYEEELNWTVWVNKIRTIAEGFKISK